jgi:hypothetical protein
MSQDDFTHKVKEVPRVLQSALVIGMIFIVITGIFSRPVILLLEEAVAALF